MIKLRLPMAILLMVLLTTAKAQKDSSRPFTAEFKAGSKNIHINGENRNIILQSWKEDKIKIVAGPGIVDAENKDEAYINEVLEKMGVTVHELGTGININIKQSNYFNEYSVQSYSNSNVSVSGSGTVSTITVDSTEKRTTYNGVHVVKRPEKKVGTYSKFNWNDGSKKSVTIYLPESSKITLDEKYANLTCKGSYDKLDLDITNGNLDLESAKDLKLISKYGNAVIGDIRNGEIDFINGNLTLNTIGTLDLDSKYSSVEIGTVHTISFISTNDEYDLDEAGEVTGRKNYGNLRISKLSKSLDFSGTNSDVKVRSIAESVTSLKLDDKYASLRLPLQHLKDYSVDVTGQFNTVYPDKPTAELVSNDVSNLKDSYSFSTGSGKGTGVKIKCSNCTIDLK